MNKGGSVQLFFVSAILTVAFSTGCASAPQAPTPVVEGGGWVESVSTESPQPTTTPVAAAPKKIVLVLSGGMARGFAHLGVLSVLEKEQIPIVKIYGIEMGGWVSLLYANKGTANQLEWEMQKISDEVWGESQSFLSQVFNLGSKSFELPQEALIKAAEKIYGDSTIENLKRPACAFVQRLDSSQVECPGEGLSREAAVASVANQGWFESVDLGSRKVSSALWSAPVAVEQVMRGHLEDPDARIIYIDVFSLGSKSRSRGLKSLDERKSRFIETLNSKALEHREWLKSVDSTKVFVLQPDLKGIAWLDYSKKKEAAYKGRVSTQAVMPSLRKFLDQ